MVPPLCANIMSRPGGRPGKFGTWGAIPSCGQQRDYAPIRKGDLAAWVLRRRGFQTIFQRHLSLTWRDSMSQVPSTSIRPVPAVEARPIRHVGVVGLGRMGEQFARNLLAD